MAKISLTDVTSGFAATPVINDNFTTLEAELQNKVLYRDNPTGEPNQMEVDLDMNGNRILNALSSSGDGFIWYGNWLTATDYSLNNLVHTSGNTYICLMSHTSGVFATDLAAGKWELLASKGDTGAGSGDMLKSENLTGLTDYVSARANLGVAIGVDVQGYSATTLHGGDAVALSADITPTQITANTNDYAPTGLSTANTLRLSTDASRDLTGLTGGNDGRLMIVHNVGSNALVLKNESASSTAANRFALGGADVTLAASQSVTLQYDSTSSRWRMVHTAGGAVASTAEAQALTDNTKMVTPLRLKEALQGSNQSLGASGYQKLPGGLIIQWMKQSAASGSTAITFPMAFPTACFVVTGTLGTSATYAWPFQVVEGTITASGCTIYRNDVQPAYIIALGH